MHLKGKTYLKVGESRDSPSPNQRAGLPSFIFGIYIINTYIQMYVYNFIIYMYV